jgi:hypothetical protein
MVGIRLGVSTRPGNQDGRRGSLSACLNTDPVGIIGVIGFVPSGVKVLNGFGVVCGIGFAIWCQSLCGQMDRP